MTEDIVILDGARTAIGTFGGSLAAVPPIALAATAAREALARAGVEGGRIGHVVFGHVINTEPRDMYLSRVAAIEAGVPDSAPAMNVNRLCGSGAQAIVSCVQALSLGDADFALAGGAESMSRSPYALPAARWGQKMGDTGAVDMMVGALTCPFGTGHMGVTAENVAAENQITREAQDAFALESQNRAAAAIREGRFASQIVPVEVTVKREKVGFATDEHPKATTAEALAEAEAGLPQGRLGDRRQRQRPERRRGGDRARHGRCRGEGRARAEGAGPRLRGGRCAAGGDGHRADPGGAEAPGEDRTCRSTTSMSSSRTRPSPPRRWRSTRGSGSTRRR